MTDTEQDQETEQAVQTGDVLPEDVDAALAGVDEDTSGQFFSESAPPTGLLDPTALPDYADPPDSWCELDDELPTGLLDPMEGLIAGPVLDASAAVDELGASEGTTETTAEGAAETAPAEETDWFTAAKQEVTEALEGTSKPSGQELATALEGATGATYEDALASLPPEQQVAARALEAEKLARVERLAEEVSDGDGGFLSQLDDGIGKAQLKAELASMPPAMREAVVAKMTGEDGAPTSTGETAAAMLEEVQHDEERAAKAAARREEKISTSVDEVEAAAAKGNPKAMAASLDKLSLSQREDALERMSPDARAAAEEQLAKRRERLEKAAQTLAEAADGGGTNEIAIVKTMSGLSPSEAEELEEIYNAQKDEDGKPRRLRSDMLAEFEDDDEKGERDMIRAVLDGDEEAKQLSVDVTVKYIEQEADAWISSDEAGINDLLRAHADNPDGARVIAEAYQRKTGKDLTSELEDIMNEAELKEATAYERGDKRSANVAAIEQGDAERTELIVDEADEEGELAHLAEDVQAHTGRPATEVLAEQLPEGELAEVSSELEAAQTQLTEARDARLQQAHDELAKDPAAYAKSKAKAEEVAGKLATELGKGHYIGNNFDVTTQLQGLEPAEVKLVMDEYKKQMQSIGRDGDLEADLRGKLEGKDLKVANAVLSGDKVLAAVATVEQAADGFGTNLDAWQKAMDSLEKPEDRARFKALMDQHVGGKDGSASRDLVRSETSSFDRDLLEAKAIENEDERVAAIAQVEVSKAAYGGQYATLVEGLDDTVGDALGVSEEERAQRRQQRRETDFMMMYSNAGGGEEQALDALERLQNPRQRELFEQRMLLANGESAAETVDGELSEHANTAAHKYLEGDFEGGLSQRMLASADGWVNDDEDGISKGFEKVRLDPAKQAELAKIEDPVERERAKQAALADARASLLARVDADAREAGRGGYDQLRAQELSDAEKLASDDRIKEGKISEVNDLWLAGDTTIGNLGKNAPKFYETLQHKTPDEVATFRADFKAKHGVDLDEWMMSKATSDGEKRDFKILLEGNYARMTDEQLAAKAKEDPQALIARVKDLHHAARGGSEDRPYDPLGNLKREVGNEVGNLMADNIGDVGERLDARMNAVQALEDKLARGEALSDDENQQLIDHMRYMAGDQKGYTDTKTKAAQKTAEVAGAATEIAVTATTGNTTAAEFAGGLVEIEVQSTLDPARTSTDDLVAKSTKVAADVAFSAAGNKWGKNPVGEALIEGVGGGLADTVGNTRNWNDAGTFVDSAGRNMAQGAQTALVDAAIETSLGEGVVGTVTSGVADTAMTGDLSKSGGELFADTAKSVAIDLAKNKAKAHHDQKHPSRPAASTAPADDTDIPVTVDEPTDVDADADIPVTLEAPAPPRAPSQRLATPSDARVDLDAMMDEARREAERALPPGFTTPELPAGDTERRPERSIVDEQGRIDLEALLREPGERPLAPETVPALEEHREAITKRYEEIMGKNPDMDPRVAEERARAFVRDGIHDKSLTERVLDRAPGFVRAAIDALVGANSKLPQSNETISTLKDALPYIDAVKELVTKGGDADPKVLGEAALDALDKGGAALVELLPKEVAVFAKPALGQLLEAWKSQPGRTEGVGKVLQRVIAGDRVGAMEAVRQLGALATGQARTPTPAEMLDHERQVTALENLLRSFGLSREQANKEARQQVLEAIQDAGPARPKELTDGRVDLSTPEQRAAADAKRQRAQDLAARRSLLELSDDPAERQQLAREIAELERADRPAAATRDEDTFVLDPERAAEADELADAERHAEQLATLHALAVDDDDPAHVEQLIADREAAETRLRLLREKQTRRRELEEVRAEAADAQRAAAELRREERGDQILNTPHRFRIQTAPLEEQRARERAAEAAAIEAAIAELEAQEAELQQRRRL